jgi:UDP-GlcNAc:undecaprenyl-phosphate GlcNAc-1-phosphate transferase
VSHASSTLFPVLMPVVVLAVPIVDTATVVFIRLREGRPIYVGDARHLSHQLVRLGFSQRKAVLIIYLVTFSLGIGALFLVDASPGRSAIILAQIASVVALVLILMFGTNGKGAHA